MIKNTLGAITTLCTISLLTMSAGCGSGSDSGPGTSSSDSPPAGTSSAGRTTFSQGSFWYAKVPASVQLNANSGKYITEFLRQLSDNSQTVNINTSKFSAPVYVADASTPTVSVTQWDCQSKGYSDAELAKQWSAVPVPAAALPSNDSDAEMVIYQPSTDTLWEFWKARKVNGNWQGCWGGRMQNASQNIGIWTGIYGATSTGLPLVGGMISPEELQAGVINHVIGISLVDIEDSGIFSWPATRSDGVNQSNAPDRIPAGLRFRLDPTINVDTLNMTPVGKIIAKAAQTYGFVVWDKAGAISLRATDPKTYTQLGKPDPYLSLYNSMPSYSIMNNFPWDKLQFLPMNYGKGE